MKVSALAFLALVAPSLASQCTKLGSYWYCGQIVNNSGRELRYTTNPTTGSGPPNKCHFWNWENKGDAIVNCTQLLLRTGGTAGSGVSTKQGVDVDGFTFADVSYTYNGNTFGKGGVDEVFE
ncbi:hypothetical protein N0V90_012381 [Kalmusia sp. IMI 367209]|nr:hypothetical protein N0V90_012381 [Kalmusia sp. IMI 367209]